MKLYNYNNFLNESNTSKRDFIHRKRRNFINKICEEYGIENYTINSDGTIDVNGNVSLFLKKFNTLPIKFNRVYGSFNCGNSNLTTLKGTPKYVGGDFECGLNKLNSLEGCPKSVGGNFSCRFNDLESLEGGPESVASFNCSYNNLTTLKGGPKTVIGFYECISNNIKDFEGFPEFYYGTIRFMGNPVNEILRAVFSISDLKKCQFIHLLNEYDVIRDGHIIIRDRLEAAYEGVGLELPENIKIEGYEII